MADLEASRRYEMLGSRYAPLLFVDSDGKLHAQLPNNVAPGPALEVMKRILKRRPEFEQETEAERAATGLDRAEILIDLLEYDQARTLLARETGARAAYLRARIARYESLWETMEEALLLVDDPALADDVLLERAWRLWRDKDFETLARTLAAIPRASNRYSEARYLAGLAAFHAGDKETALGIWEQTVRSCPQDGWIYRADWAWDSIVHLERKVLSREHKGSTPLGRIGYAGLNPDLKRD